MFEIISYYNKKYPYVKYFTVYIIIVSICIYITIIICNKKKNELFDNTENIKQKKKITDINYYKYGSPLKNLVDEKGNILNIALIIYPFTDENKYKTYLEAKKKGMKFIGCSSYINFPCKTKNIYDITYKSDNISWNYDYMNLCFGWFHCFRDPTNNCISENIPKALISESDFIRNESFNYNENIIKEYDFIYICLKDNDKCINGWQSSNRNWELAKKCIDIMCGKYKMNGLLIGRINCIFPENYKHLITTTDFLNYNIFIKQYEKCRFIFLPNILDASPRVLTEALSFNLPCIVNYNILGGWKYVNKNTGHFFNDENDFEYNLNIFLSNFSKYKPRKYFLENHGKHIEGKQIIEFIKKYLPNYKTELNIDIDKVDYIIPVV